MKKIILSLENLSLDKELFNMISLKYRDNINVVGITNSIIETISFINKYSPDIIFIDSFSYLRLIEQTKYDAIYFIDDENNLIIDLNANMYSTHLCKSFGELVRKFRSIEDSFASRKVEIKIETLFKSLNFNFKLSGTRYLFDILIFTYETKNNNLNLLNNLSKNFYETVSNKYHTSKSRVKWNIENSIKQMYEYNLKHNPKTFEKYLHTKLEHKPTIKEFIITLNSLL